MNTILQTAIAVHEVFDSYVKAGFTREEALEILKLQLTEEFRGKK